MMDSYNHLCDDHYINLTVSTVLDLPSQRETLIHFFERIQKSYPALQNFYTRDGGEQIVLEEDRIDNTYRWLTVEARRLGAGSVNPPSTDSAIEFHRLILENAPFHLSLSPLDCEAIDILFGFDFTYQGNHNQLVADVLGVPAAFEGIAEIPSVQVVHYEPSLTLTFDQDCRLQCRVNIETRTNDYHVRRQDYPEEQISVYLTCRHYGVLPGENGFVRTLELIATTGTSVVEEFVIPLILEPLAKAIALR
ncbi:MAG: hypothetical protein ACUVQR_04785 [Thermogutta sp.]